MIIYKKIENLLTKKMKINIHSNDLKNEEDTKEGKYRIKNRFNNN